MDWYLQLYIIKNDKQKFLFKIMKNRTYSQNFSSLTEQTSIVVNLKREWIYYCSVLSVYFILIMPLLLISLNHLSLITKLMLMILIFIFYLLLNLYKVSYNNQHIILKYNEELNKKQETSKNFIKIKTKNKYVLNKIINFIPLYLSIFGLIAYIVISYQTLLYLYNYPANEIINPINKKLILVFFTSYNYVHIILYHFLMLLFLTWIMQIMTFYLLDLNTFNNNKKDY